MSVNRSLRAPVTFALGSMSRTWLAHRLERTVQSTPAIFRWLEQCDTEVIQAYRSARRSLFAWQLPALAVAAAIATAVKALQWLPPGHPVLVALFLASLAILAWPFKLMRFATVAWQKAPTEPRFSARLRLFAIVIYGSSAVFAVGMAALTAFFVYGMFK